MENSTKPTTIIYSKHVHSLQCRYSMGHAIHKCLFDNINMSHGHRPQCYEILQPLTSTDMRNQRERPKCVSNVGLDRPLQHHGQRRFPESSIQRTSSLKSRRMRWRDK